MVGSVCIGEELVSGNRLGNQDIGFLANCNGTEFFFQSHGIGGVEGGGMDGLFREHFHADAGQGYHQAHVTGGA